MIRLQSHNRTADKLSSSRRGVTMTEVLIAIMILGIGMTSLMTLFPIGLMKLRDARRNNRASLLAENVASDLKTRDLLSRYSFAATLNASGVTGGNLFDPWTKDIQALYDKANAANVIEIQTATGFGIPIVCCYDPLFYSNLAYTNSPAFSNVSQLVDPKFRFGRAFGNDLRSDPDGSRASGFGLPRLTNIWPALAASTLPSIGNINSVASIFVSQDDAVFPDFENEANPKIIDPKFAVTRQNPILPLVDNASTGAYSLNDWDYSWIFTGKSRDRNVFEGDMVIYNKRQFGVNTDSNNAVTGISGERVVEGIFGLGSVPMTTNNGTMGYAAGKSRKVLLMWPKIDGAERPEIKIGGWIADVTYEPYLNTTVSRFMQDFDGDGRPDVEHPGQRCHWYRIVQRSEVTDPYVADPGLSGLTNMEAMIVTVDRPVVSKTLLKKSGAGYQPVHVNAALIAPEVVAVFPITLEGR
jgi:prepilin-type N-terminal cleavage/methylation domain-containing protein